MTCVSVVIPTYNRATLISQTLDSVLAQTYKDTEVIVVDDGSTDDTSAVLSTYLGQIAVIRQANQGLSGARNAGIAKAKGEFVAFLDSDDLWLPEKLEKQITLLESRSELKWAYTDIIAFEHDSGQPLYMLGRTVKLHQGDVLDELLFDDFIASPTPLIRREVFDEVGLFSDNTVVAEDWDMWLRIAARYPVGLIAAPLAKYRIHTGMKTRARPWQQHYTRCVNTIERAVSRNPERLSPLRDGAVARVCINVGRRLMGEGNLHDARRMFLRAIRYAPGELAPYLHWLMCLSGQAAVEVGHRIQTKIRARWA